MTIPPITLADASDTYNFRVGMPLVLDLCTGAFRRATWRDRVRAGVLRWTRWWWPRYVVAEIAVAAGVLTMAQERWSWRRWRWERA